uniref:Uncharacterized protein n=1 Tax=Amphimedon queenslandica TaxID=400682 RepID=A0A1X7UNE5_AMPQE
MVESLESTVASLSDRVSSLESSSSDNYETLSNDMQSVCNSLRQITQAPRSSIQSNVQHHSSGVNTSGDRSVDRNSTLEMRASSQDHWGLPTSSRDRSGHLVVSGLPECPCGTARTDRAIQDQDKVISVLSSLCSSLSTHSLQIFFFLVHM